MADISLLPEEMRKKEEQEKARALKKDEGVVLRVPLESAAGPKTAPTKTVVSERKAGWLFERLFGKKAGTKPPDATPKLPTVPLMGEKKPSPPPVPPSPSLKLQSAPTPTPTAPQRGGGVTPPKFALHMAEQMSAGSLRVSLIPTTAERTASEKEGLRKILMIVLVVGAVLATASGGAYYYMSRQRAATDELKAKSADALARLSANRKDYLEASKEAKRLNYIQKLLDNHLVWSKLFEFLEKNTHRKIGYTLFSSEGLDTVSLQAEAENYQAIAEAVQALADAPETSEVKVSGLSSIVAGTGQITAVRLTITIKFDSKLIQLAKEKPAP